MSAFLEFASSGASTSPPLNATVGSTVPLETYRAGSSVATFFDSRPWLVTLGPTAAFVEEALNVEPLPIERAVWFCGKGCLAVGRDRDVSCGRS